MSTCRKCARRYPDDHHFCPIDGEPLAGDDLVGTTLLGLYQLTRIIGQGSSGTVYEAWQTPIDRRVAVKMLHPMLLADRGMVRRFDREARAAARLNHPNVVTLHGSGVTDDGVPFLVMELVSGEPLDRVLEDGALSPGRAVAITQQIVAGVAATHAAGIVHRDLKPANVILLATGDTESPDRVKLVDFGVAKIIAGEVGDDSALSRTGTVWGTPHYLAPEQARGEKVDGRADLYSIGVILYEMVTGQVPFPGTGMSVLLAHVNRPVPPPESLVPNLDPGLVAVILRCLAKDPRDRFATADELAVALDQVARADPAGVSMAMAATLPQLGARDDAGDDPAMGAVKATGWPLTAGDAALSGDQPSGAATGRLPVVEGGESVREPAARWRGRWALAVAVAVIGFVASHWIDLDPPEAPRSGPAGVTPAAAPPVAVAAPGIRVVVIAEGGYALRVLLPERVVVGVEHEVLIDAWDRDGEPIAAAELIVTIDDPTGVSRGIAAKPTSEPGRYRFRRTFSSSGPHIMRVYPPAGGARIQLFYDVVGAADPG